MKHRYVALFTLRSPSYLLAYRTLRTTLRVDVSLPLVLQVLRANI